jgi:hypothetical protein
MTARDKISKKQLERFRQEAERAASQATNELDRFIYSLLAILADPERRVDESLNQSGVQKGGGTETI